MSSRRLILVCVAAVTGLLLLLYGVWFLGSRSPDGGDVAAVATTAESVSVMTETPTRIASPESGNPATPSAGVLQSSSRPPTAPAAPVTTAPPIAPPPSQPPRPLQQSRQCPTGTVTVEVPPSGIKIEPSVRETYRHVTARGVLKNTTSGDVFLFADDPPQLLALDGGGNILEMVTVGTFDNQRGDGLPRTQGIVLKPGQSISFTLDEERGSAIDDVASWFADARVGALMASWNQASPDCPSPLPPNY